MHVGLYVQFRIVLLPALCALDVYWSSLGLSVFDVDRTRCAALYMGLYMRSRIVLLSKLCALEVC